MVSETNPERVAADVADAVVWRLKEMGQECPVGLRAYPEYYCKEHPNCRIRDTQVENLLVLGLSEGIDVPVASEVRYPDYVIDAFRREHGSARRRAAKCDLVFSCAGNGRFWVEVKTAFRQLVQPSQAGSDWKNDYSGQRLLPSSHGARDIKNTISDIPKKDVRLLDLLKRPDAHLVGVLLLGFDREQEPITRDDLATHLQGALDNWAAAHPAREGFLWRDSYEPRARLGFRERVWFWYKPVR